MNMKQFNDYILPDVGKIFKYNNTISFKLSAECTGYEEVEINKGNVEFIGNFVFVDKVIGINLTTDKHIKTVLVNKLFSNDDQIAIILNEDTEMMTFMNDWREWFSQLIKEIKNHAKQ